MLVGRLSSLNRKDKFIIVQSLSGKTTQLTYDFLVFANGLEERTIDNVIESFPPGEAPKPPSSMLSVDKLHVSLCEALCSDSNLSQFAYLLNWAGKDE